METPPLDLSVPGSPDGPTPEPPRTRRRWGRGLLITLFVVGIVLGGAAATLIKSGPGQRYVMGKVLDQAHNLLAGPLTVDGIWSGSLLGGATLRGVRLEAEGGRRFLEADSVVVEYSLLSLFGGVPRLARVTLFQPHVEISRYPGEELVNVARLLASQEGPGGGRGVRLGSIRVVGGVLEVLTPMEGQPSPRTLVVPSPAGEGTLRRLAFDGVTLELEDVLVGAPGEDLFQGHLVDLAMDVHLLDRPLTISHIDGAVRWGPNGLAVSDASFRTPSSAFEGSLTLGTPEGEGTEWGFHADLVTQGPAALADLAWLDDRLPLGVFRGRIAVSAGEAVDVSFDQIRVELEASRLSLNGGIRVDDGVQLRDLEIQASPLALSRLQPWLEADLPLDGWLSGNLLLSGRTTALRTDGRVTLVPVGFGGEPTTADVHGVVHLGRDPGVTNLRALLDPLNLRLAQAFQPSLTLSGRGRAAVEASGRVDSGIRFVADLSHGVDRPTPSRVLVQGSARRGEGEGWVMDVQGDLSPLALDLIHQVAPGFASVGGIEGSVRAVGPLSHLRFNGALALAEGNVTVSGEADLADIGRAYRLDATLDDVLISGVLTALPDPSRWSGRVVAEARGTDLASLEGSGTLTARTSRLGGLQVDSLDAEVRVSGGLLTVDTVSGTLGGMRVQGAGDLGLTPGASGRAHFTFSTPDLGGLRPVLMGDTVMARDTLSVLERQLLRLQGVDADTLPLLSDVAMSGAMEGTVDLSGTLSELGVTGQVRMIGGVYGADSVGVADVSFVARDVTEPGRSMTLDVVAEDVVAFGRSLSELRADVRLEGRGGEGTASALQVSGERYQVSGAFAFDSLTGGGSVHLQQASLDVDSVSWHLEGPTEIVWDSMAVTFADVRVTGNDLEPMVLSANGTLAWVGTSDLVVEGEGIHLDRIALILQRDGLVLGGDMDLTLRVTGPARAPDIEASFSVEEPRYGTLSLTRLVGGLSYSGQVADITMEALSGERLVFRAAGEVPVDLALRPEGRRIVQRSMDVRVEADSLDASLALSPLGFLENVEGFVSGDFRIRGPLDRPEPSGVLHMQRAAWSMEALGVRHSGVTGSLTLNPDRTVDVEMDGVAAGTTRIRGQVVLDPLDDPRLDLTLGFQGFQAVNRPDVAGRMSGEIRLLGSYRAPRVEGSLTVDQGTLFLEEFARNAEVIDLTDPRIFQVVDTTALSTRPLLAGIRNPFLQNLRVDVDLAVPRDTWLRSADMNVEIGGQLLVRYDRLSRDIVMVGELEALRGTYTVLGRRFEVEGGLVRFIGTPGINPILSIQATTPVRRAGGSPLNVNATVAGTLTQPRVSLSSDEQGVAESDLVSYLIFGRPSSELASGQQALLRGAAGSGVTFVTGTVAARLGAALSQEIGIDYLSISQAGDFGVASGTLGGSLAGTQVEVGQYLGEDLFFVLIFRPLNNQTTGQRFFGGARVEWAITDDYNVQGFWEDRFLRSRIGGFGDLGVQASQVVGVFIFREWGY